MLPVPGVIVPVPGVIVPVVPVPMVPVPPIVPVPPMVPLPPIVPVPPGVLVVLPIVPVPPIVPGVLVVPVVPTVGSFIVDAPEPVVVVAPVPGVLTPDVVEAPPRARVEERRLLRGEVVVRGVVARWLVVLVVVLGVDRVVVLPAPVVPPVVPPIEPEPPETWAKAAAGIRAAPMTSAIIRMLILLAMFVE